MKGGKDMKKIYKFEEQKEKYVILYESNEIFEIYKDTLKIDGNKFYDAFFESYSNGDIIELEKGSSIIEENKLSNAIYNTVNNLFNEIVQKINEQKQD